MTVSVPLPHRVGQQIPIPPVPMHSLLLNLIQGVISEDPERIAIVHYDNPKLPTITYKKLVELATKYARFIQDKGLVKKGEVVNISVPNSYHYATALLAVPANGGVLSGFSHKNSPDEALYQMNNSEGVLLITSSERLQNIVHLLEKVPKLKSIILVDTPSSKDLLKKVKKQQVFLWDNIIKEAKAEFDFDSVEFDVQEDLYTLPYSSGTTGLPKGVMITHYNYVAMLIGMKTHTEQNILEAMKPYVDDITAPDHTLALTPLYHAMGFFLLNANLCRGQTIVIIQKYSDKVVFEAIQKFRPRGFTVVPAVVQRFLQSPLAKNYDISSLVNIGTGGSTQSAELAQQFQKNFPATKVMSQGYGMTELTTVAFSSSIDAIAGSIGIILPNNEYRIVEPNTQKECGTNEVGELWVRGPTKMKGYWRNQKATDETITKDGWLKTGDLVREDESRQLFVVSRLKELIKVNAFQVAPTELEELLSTLEGVADSAVIGIPDAKSGEIPRAFVVKKRGVKLEAKQVYDHVAAKTSHYKWLKGGVQFVDSIPRSEAGKILRRQILQEYLKSKKSKL